MHPDLERLLSEDEAARASVERAQRKAAADLERIGHELAERRENRLRVLREQVDQAVAAVLAEGDREVERRQAQRAQSARETAERARQLVAAACDLWVSIVRTHVTAERGL